MDNERNKQPEQPMTTEQRLARLEQDLHVLRLGFLQQTRIIERLTSLLDRSR